MNTPDASTPFSFLARGSNPKVQTAMLLGTGRSGKTTLGNILATCGRVEYADEPWPLHIASVMTSLSMLTRQVGEGMFGSYLGELVNDTILMRNANFRPSDLSTIVTKKTPEEIQSRLHTLKTREDVARFIEAQNPLLLLAFSADPGVNLRALTEFLPDSKVVYVVRRGIDVAGQVEGKRWFSEEQLRAPSQAQVVRSVPYKGAPAYVYAWVPEGREEEFLNYSEYERGLMYWCTLMEKSITVLESLEAQGRVLVVKYEELLANPQETLQHVTAFLGVEQSAMTKPALDALQTRDRVEREAPLLTDALRLQAQRIYTHFGYDWK